MPQSSLLNTIMNSTQYFLLVLAVLCSHYKCAPTLSSGEMKIHPQRGQFPTSLTAGFVSVQKTWERGLRLNHGKINDTIVYRRSDINNLSEIIFKNGELVDEVYYGKRRIPPCDSTNLRRYSSVVQDLKNHKPELNKILLKHYRSSGIKSISFTMGIVISADGLPDVVFPIKVEQPDVYLMNEISRDLANFAFSPGKCNVSQLFEISLSLP